LIFDVYAPLSIAAVDRPSTDNAARPHPTTAVHNRDPRTRGRNGRIPSVVEIAASSTIGRPQATARLTGRLADGTDASHPITAAAVEAGGEGHVSGLPHGAARERMRSCV